MFILNNNNTFSLFIIQYPVHHETCKEEKHSEVFVFTNSILNDYF